MSASVGFGIAAHEHSCSEIQEASAGNSQASGSWLQMWSDPGPVNHVHEQWACSPACPRPASSASACARRPGRRAPPSSAPPCAAKAPPSARPPDMHHQKQAPARQTAADAVWPPRSDLTAAPSGVGARTDQQVDPSRPVGRYPPRCRRLASPGWLLRGTEINRQDRSGLQLAHRRAPWPPRMSRIDRPGCEPKCANARRLLARFYSYWRTGVTYLRTEPLTQ